jgi:hypothetical protein
MTVDILNLGIPGFRAESERQLDQGLPRNGWAQKAFRCV